jgi:hypothetical protein
VHRVDNGRVIVELIQVAILTLHKEEIGITKQGNKQEQQWAWPTSDRRSWTHPFLESVLQAETEDTKDGCVCVVLGVGRRCTSLGRTRIRSRHI